MASQTAAVLSFVPRLADGHAAAASGEPFPAGCRDDDAGALPACSGGQVVTPLPRVGSLSRSAAVSTVPVSPRPGRAAVDVTLRQRVGSFFRPAAVSTALVRARLERSALFAVLPRRVGAQAGMLRLRRLRWSDGMGSRTFRVTRPRRVGASAGRLR